MAEKDIKFTPADLYLLSCAVEVKLASVTRAYNAARDADLRAVYEKQLSSYEALSLRLKGF